MFLGCFVLWNTKKVCMNCFILLLCERHYSTQDREAALNTAKQAAAFIWKTLHKIKMERQFVFFYNDFDTSLQLYFLKILERKNFILQLIWNLNCFFHGRLCLRICWFPVWITGRYIAESQCCDGHLHCFCVVAVAVLCCCSLRPAPIFLGIVWNHNKIRYLP